MPFAPEDIQAIHELFAPIIGREAWGVHVGYGARLTIHFGAGRTETRTARSGKQWSSTHGEWDVWTDSCVWRVEDATSVLAAYEDPRPLMDSAFARLNGRRLLSIDVSPTSADTVFTFDDGILLRLFSIYMAPDGDQAHWMLFAPAHQVLVIGPSTRWSYERSDKRSDPSVKSNAVIDNGPGGQAP